MRNLHLFGAPVGIIFAIDRRLKPHSWIDLGMFAQSVMIAAKARRLVWRATALQTVSMSDSEMPWLRRDVPGRGYDQFTEDERKAVLAAFPREANFKSGIIDAFYQGMKHRPDSTFGTFNDDFLAHKDPCFRRTDMCAVIFASKWEG